MIEDKIFKYKFRMNADPVEVYTRRETRRLERFGERLQHRDPRIEQNLSELYQRDSVQRSLAQLALDGTKVEGVAE